MQTLTETKTKSKTKTILIVSVILAAGAATAFSFISLSQTPTPLNSCVDPDAAAVSNDIYFATTTVIKDLSGAITQSAKDTCTDILTLKEYRCGFDTAANKYSITERLVKCYDGGCKDTEPFRGSVCLKPNHKTCEDKDGGFSIDEKYTAGNIWLRDSAGNLLQERSDACVSLTSLRDWHCSVQDGDYLITEQQYYCQYGCASGKCKPPPLLIPR